MRYLAITFSLLTLHCHDVYKAFASLHEEPPSIINLSEYPDGLFYKVWSELETTAQVDISLDGMTATVHGDRARFEDACPDVEGLGCSDYDNLNVYGGVGTDFLDVGTETAHQLGHLYFYHTHGGSDGRHAHADWWDDGGYVDLIHHLIEAGTIQ